MQTVTISPKFQVVIPQSVREAMGLHSGEKAHVIAYRNRIEIIPVRDVRTLRGYLKGIDTSLVREEEHFAGKANVRYKAKPKSARRG